MASATNISAVLRHQGRSDRWFYQRMEVSESLFYAIERGERRPTLSYRQKAAELLDVPVGLLFLGGDSLESVGSSPLVEDEVPA
jgi:transcriptional regulator with XRE-family HTH domain